MKAQKSVLFVLPLFLSLCARVEAANSVLYVYPSNSDLTSSSSFSTSNTSDISATPGNTSDIEFFNTTYSPAAFTLNASENWGTLNDLSGTTLTIDNKATSAPDTLTLSGGSNSVSGTSSDYIYVASGESLSIGTASTSTLTVDLGAASGNIDNNGTLNMASALVFNGSSATQKLTFTGSGSTTLSGGITVGDSNSIVVNSTGTVTLSGSNDAAKSTILNAGTLNVSDKVTGNVVVNGGTFSETSTGYLNGASSVSLTVNGGTVTIAGTNSSQTYTGSGGTTIDDGATLTLTGLIGSVLTLGNNTTVGGGNLSYGRSGTNTETWTSTTLNAGASAVSSTVSSDTVALAAITRNVGSTLNLGTTGTITTTTPNANISGGQQTILGGYAILGGTTWAVSGSGGTAGTITGLATGSYSTAFTAATDVDAQTGTSTPGTLTINSLRFNNSGAYTVNQGGTLTVATGGILETTGVGAHAAAINGGTLASGNSTDLIVTQNNTSVGLTIGSQITGTGIGLTKSGAGALTLAGANNYTGVTTVNAGSLLLGTGGTINTTTGVSVAGGATFGTSTSNGSALTLTSNAPTLTLNLGTSTATQSNLQLNLFSSGSSDTIDVSTLTLNAVPSGATGTVLLTLNDTTGDNLSGQYNLLTWTSSSPVTITTSDFTLAGSAASEGTLGLNGDDLIFTAAPEPSTWALFIGGLGLLGIYRFRRSQFKPEAEPDSIPSS